MNKELYNELSTAAEYIDVITDSVFKLDEKRTEPQRIKEEFYEKHQFKNVGLHILLSVIAWVLTIGCPYWIFGYSIINAESKNSGYRNVFEEFGFSYTEQSTLNTMFYAVPIILFFIGLFGVIFLRLDTKNKERARDRLCEKETAPLIEKSTEEFNAMWSAYEDFVQKNIHVIEFLPMQYRDQQAVSYMLVAVSSGRAETFKEAMELYELQLHRWKVEDAARQAAEAQEYAALAMQELGRQQREANETLRRIEYAQWLDYMDK